LFAQLVEGEHGLLRRCPIRRVRNPADAEDVVQESLLKAITYTSPEESHRFEAGSAALR